VLLDEKDSETVVSQEMVRHGSVDETLSGDTVAEGGSGRADVKDGIGDEDNADIRLETTGDGWLTGWKLPVLSDVVSKTSSVVQQTVQQTSNVVCHLFCCITYLTCFITLTDIYACFIDILTNSFFCIIELYFSLFLAHLVFHDMQSDILRKF